MYIKDKLKSSTIQEESKYLTILDEPKSSATLDDHKFSTKLKTKSKELKKEVGLNKFVFFLNCYNSHLEC